MTQPEIRYGNESRPRQAGLLATLLLHGVAAAAILMYPPVRSSIATSMPIMIELIAPAPEAIPRQALKPLPARKQPEEAKPVAQLRLVAHSSDSPAPNAVPAPAERALPPIEAAARQSAPAPATAAAPPVLVSPRFDAAYLQNPPPVYPPLARRLGEQGRVLLQVFVTADGVAGTVDLRSTSGSERLDRAALETVRLWRFVPARQGETPVAAWVLVPISFSLEG